MATYLSSNTKAVLERLCVAATGYSENNWRSVDLGEVAHTDIADSVFEKCLAKLQTAGLFIPVDLPLCRVRDMAFEELPRHVAA